MFTEILNGITTEFADAVPYLFRLVIAVVCGSTIGIERMIRQKEAGIRTHIIVALGSALMMIVSKYGFFDVIVNDSVSVDASRIAANIITGVSFLGSGIIIYRGSIKGLTTAAGVWATSGIGMAIGAGLYGIGIISTVMILIIQICIHRFLPIENISTNSVIMKIKDEPDSLHAVHELLKKYGCEVINCNVEKKDEVIYLTFDVKSKNTLDFDRIQNIFSECNCVLGITYNQ